VTAPLTGQIPAILFQNLDEFLDLHSDSGLEVSCRITSELSGAPLARPVGAGQGRKILERFVMCKIHSTST